VHHEARGFHIGGLEMKYREIVSIIIGAVVYTAAVTLAIAGFSRGAVDKIGIALVGGLLFFGVRELGRIILCYFKGLHTEYIIWIPGMILTLVTGFLGNTLNAPGFVIEHKDKEIRFSAYAFVKYIIVFFTALLATGLFLYNIVNPSRGIQIFAIISSTYAMAEMMPFSPMPGKDIIKWRPVLYAFTFMAIIVMYVMFNFVI